MGGFFASTEEKRPVAYDADLSATHNPATGNTPTAAWGDKINDNFATLGGTWTAFTPTWTGATANPAIGNGTLTGHYMQAGKLLAFRIYVLMGGTTTYGTGAWRFSLPNSLTVAGASSLQAFSGFAYDTSAGFAYVLVGAADSGLAYLTAWSNGAGNVLATSPFTWASGDKFALTGVIEVA